MSLQVLTVTGKPMQLIVKVLRGKDIENR